MKNVKQVLADSRDRKLLRVICQEVGGFLPNSWVCGICNDGLLHPSSKFCNQCGAEIEVIYEEV